MIKEAEQLYLEYINKRRVSPDPNQIGPYFGGFLHGNEILFVGQNFGAPLKFDTTFLPKVNEMSNDYIKLMDFFEEQWWTSRFGKFLINTLSDLQLRRWDISFINFAPWMTQRNMFPQITKLEYDLFTNQLEILQPKLIIYLSYSIKKLVDEKFPSLVYNNIYFTHPASRRYSVEYKDEIVTRIKSKWIKTI